MNWLKKWLRDRRVNKLLAELNVLSRVEDHCGKSDQIDQRKRALADELLKLSEDK